MTSLSIVIPIKDEAESIYPLYKELLQVIRNLNAIYEIICIDDGSEDQSVSKVQELQKKDKHINLIRFRGNFGKSAALSAGLDVAKYDTIVTIDADLQDDPNELPKMLKKLDEGYDLVSGWRRKRNDNTIKRVSSYLFNSGTAFISGVKLHDFNCGLKVFRKKLATSLNLHGELHRFIPILAAKMKFRVTEVQVNHRARRYGISKFGVGRSWRGMLDLLTAIFITDYSTKPAHFFGRIGLIFFIIGFIMDAYVTYIKITTGSTQDRIPLLLAGILFILLGVQLLSTGLIAEMISHYMLKNKEHDLSSKV